MRAAFFSVNSELSWTIDQRAGGFRSNIERRRSASLTLIVVGQQTRALRSDSFGWESASRIWPYDLSTQTLAVAEPAQKHVHLLLDAGDFNQTRLMVWSAVRSVEVLRQRVA